MPSILIDNSNGAGTNVKNWRDFYNTATQATPDLGAVVI
jgi:hypothetical protein